MSTEIQFSRVIGVGIGRSRVNILTFLFSDMTEFREEVTGKPSDSDELDLPALTS